MSINTIEINNRPSPEERTAAFFAQDVHDLESRLVGMRIENSATGNSIVVLDTNTFVKAENTRQYKPVQTMEPGRFFACEWPFRKTVLPLISALDGTEKGGCVQIVEAAQPNETRTNLKDVKRLRDVSSILGVRDGSSARLAFLNDSETLYVIPEDEAANEDPKNAEPVVMTDGEPVEITPKQANEVFASITQEK